MKVSDEQLLSMLLSGSTQADICRELGMCKQQVSKRVNSPQIQEMLSEYRQKVLDGVFTDLTANTRKAADTLVKLLDHKNAFVQYNAACKILSTVTDISLMKDLMKDIADLKEAQQAEQQKY